MVNKRLLGLILVPILLFGGTQANALEKKERLWQDETVYHIQVDRFNNGDRENDFNVNVKDENGYNGGDFQGVIDKLDYVKEMGFTTVSLSPVFDNEDNGYHGNWVKDYYKTEEHFGSLKEFKKLVKEAHERDMKVVLEFVVDSVGPNHPWTKDAGRTNWLTDGAKLNHDNPKVANYLIEAAKWWIEETEIDGYYVSDISEVPNEFLEEFSDKVKEKEKDFFLIGNTNETDSKKLAEIQKLGFDSVVNRSLMEPLRDAFSKNDANSENAVKVTQENRNTFEKPEQLLTILDDETVKRFTRDMVEHNQNPGTRWKLALSYAYTTPGIPSLFYGSEIAVDGGDAPDNQRIMGFKADKELIDYITLLGDLRQELPALTRGDYELLHQENGMLIYKRSYKSENIIIAINNTSKTQHVTLTHEMLAKNQELRGLLAGDLVREDNGEYKIVIDREKAEIYALTDKTGINLGFIAAIAAVWIIFAIFIILVIKRSKRRDSQLNDDNA